MKRAISLLSILLYGCLAMLAQDGQLQFANLGNFKLVSGEIIRDCRIGYRTFGELNADRSNVVVMPTWFGGTTEELKSNVGAGRLVDDSKYYVILVDALGNGVSTSPSNSQSQPRMSFPKIGIRDMVNSEHELLTRVLHIEHVRAVMGISMGGMQTFQWLVSYPEFMDKALPIVGSPRLAPYDLALWQAENDAIMSDPGWNNGNYQENPARVARAEISALIMTTPEHYNQQNSRAAVLSSLEESKKKPAFDANNHIRQSQAMMNLDVSDTFAGSMEKAADAVKAKVLVVVALRDHVVTPEPAIDFARLLHAGIVRLEGDCGHLAPGCEKDQLNPKIASFLEQ